MRCKRSLHPLAHVPQCTMLRAILQVRTEWGFWRRFSQIRRTVGHGTWCMVPATFAPCQARRLEQALVKRQPPIRHAQEQGSPAAGYGIVRIDKVIFFILSANRVLCVPHSSRLQLFIPACIIRGRLPDRWRCFNKIIFLEGIIQVFRMWGRGMIAEEVAFVFINMVLTE